jgi:hypothetical protein
VTENSSSSRYPDCSSSWKDEDEGEDEDEEEDEDEGRGVDR